MTFFWYLALIVSIYYYNRFVFQTFNCNSISFLIEKKENILLFTSINLLPALARGLSALLNTAEAFQPITNSLLTTLLQGLAAVVWLARLTSVYLGFIGIGDTWQIFSSPFFPLQKYNRKSKIVKINGVTSDLHTPPQLI